MKDSTKLYLIAGFFYVYSTRFAFDSFAFFLGAILTGLFFGVHKVFLMQEEIAKYNERADEFINALYKDYTAHIEDVTNKKPTTTSEPYIETEIVEVNKKRYHNPDFGDDKMCECGHKYYRHFDGTLDKEDQACGCKYCECWTFKEKKDV